VSGAAPRLFPAPPGAQPQRLTSPAGGTIRYVYWRATRLPAQGTALVLPGLGEFIEKYHETVSDLLARGFEVYVMDWVGQGLSTRPLANRHKLHVLGFGRYLVDLAKLIDSVLTKRDVRPRVVVGHSLGAHLALRHARDHPRAFDAMVLLSPLAGINYGRLPGWLARLITATMCFLGFGRAYVFGAHDYDPKRKRFEGNRLTGDEARFLEQHQWIARNPELATGGPSFAWLRAAQRSMRTALRPAFLASIKAPCLLLSPAVDRIVSVAATQHLALALPNALYVEFPEAGHELLRERDAVRTMLWQRIDDFLAPLLAGEKVAATPPVPSARTG
jgi:lysophospholipase